MMVKEPYCGRGVDRKRRATTSFPAMIVSRQGINKN
jgi:hypothetical protein